MPDRTYKEKEAWLYWKACQEARHGPDKKAGYDELYCAAFFSDWPLLAKLAASALPVPAAAVRP